MVRTAIAPGPIAFVIALGAAGFMLAGGSDFCLDDAWIHLAYAKSLRLGDGLSYNPGDYATGFSSPLWVLLVAASPWRTEPVLTVKLLGALCHAATAWGAVSLTEALVAGNPASKRFRAATAGLVCALDPALAFAAVSGMEVSLTAALLVWCVRASIRGRTRIAVALAFCAVWARPESLLFIGAYSLLRLVRLRPPEERDAPVWPRVFRELTPLAAAAAALLVWIAYCLIVSGYPFPNTYYAKRDAHLVSGLMYFRLEYLPTHAWFVSVTGAALVVVTFVRAGEPRRLALAWLAASIAIAATRQIFPQILFYCWRYFAVLAAFPCVALACGLPERRGFAAGMLAPIVLATFWMLPHARELQRAQEHDITLVHTAPSIWLAHTLPPDARILVEGAGATRFRLARSVQVIDAVGLNASQIVHGSDTQQRVCAALRFRPTHVLLPADFYLAFSQLLVLAPMRSFVDPDYRIGSFARQAHISAARVLQIKPIAHQVCGIP